MDKGKTFVGQPILVLSHMRDLFRLQRVHRIHQRSLYRLIAYGRQCNNQHKCSGSDKYTGAKIDSIGINFKPSVDCIVRERYGNEHGY